MKFLTFLGICLYLLLTIISSGCSNSSSNAAAISQTIISPSVIKELPLPVIPDTITTSEDKRRYVATHYWDALDFQDTTLSLNDAFMEQSFANFIVIMQAQLNDEDVKKSMEMMLDHASLNPKALDKLKEIVELYLAEYDSPMKSEDLWISYLEVVTSDDKFTTPGEKSGYKFDLDMANKNRPGMLAQDFKYVTKNGEVKNLYTTVTGKKGLIVIFYNSDCDHCRDMIAHLREDVNFSKSLESGLYKVLAINVAADMELWQKNMEGIPENWLSGFNTDGIEDREAYYFSVFPSIYILDNNYKVMEKEARL